MKQQFSLQNYKNTLWGFRHQSNTQVTYDEEDRRTTNKRDNSTVNKRDNSPPVEVQMSPLEESINKS